MYTRMNTIPSGTLPAHKRHSSPTMTRAVLRKAAAAIRALNYQTTT